MDRCVACAKRQIIMMVQLDLQALGPQAWQPATWYQQWLQGMTVACSRVLGLYFSVWTGIPRLGIHACTCAPRIHKHGGPSHRRRPLDRQRHPTKANWTLQSGI